MSEKSKRKVREAVREYDPYWYIRLEDFGASPIERAELQAGALSEELKQLASMAQRLAEGAERLRVWIEHL